MAASAAHAQREFDLSDREFERIRRMVREHTGINLTEAKRELVYGRLAKRVRLHGLASFDAYCELLARGHATELEHFRNAITTNLTSFFREAHHFELLAEEVLPGLRRTNAQSRRLRVWSAGCSTGEEPYSIAMTMREAMPDIDDWDARILATDLDSNVLERGASGVYPLERVEAMDRARLERWFLRGGGDNQSRVRARESLRRLITFKQLNLMEDWPMRGPFDVIFCRNVVIYFDKDTQRVLLERFADLCAPGGWLFMGHSESLHNVTQRFDPVGRTAYRRGAR